MAGHKKEDSDETVYSGVSGSSEVPMTHLFLSSDVEYIPPHNSGDDRFDPRRRAFPIAQDDPIVAIWSSSLHHKVIELIKPNKDWRALDVIRRGYMLQPEDNPIVILITVAKDASVPEWQQFIYMIKKLCTSEQCPHVLAQVQEGTVFRGAFVPRLYDQRPMLGGSVGAMGSSGTLGGYIELQGEGWQPMRVGVTCHHVVVSGSEDKSHISPNDNSSIAIHHPSPLDYEENEGEAMSTIMESEKKINDIKSRAGVGLARDSELRSLPDREAILATKRALLSTTDDFNTHLGYVFASSGFRRRQREPPEAGCNIDWALIGIDPDRLGDNKFPEGVFPRFHPSTSQYITDTVAMELGDEAAKWGRETGYTVGIFNAIKSNCWLPEADGMSTEWCFVGKSGRQFADHGDSGAFVVSTSGELGGMIIGGSKRDGPGGSDLAYVTPIREVFDDIERQLRCSVRLPEV